MAQDLEPEYITVSGDSKTAWVTLQENNAIAIVDLTTATVKQLVGLGTKDHSLPGNGPDASDRDSKINIRPWPVRGFYLPDGIAAFRVGAQEYLLLANEGDARDYDGYSEETRVGNVALDPIAFPNAARLKLSANLGRLKMTSAQGAPITMATSIRSTRSEPAPFQSAPPRARSYGIAVINSRGSRLKRSRRTSMRATIQIRSIAVATRGRSRSPSLLAGSGAGNTHSLGLNELAA